MRGFGDINMGEIWVTQRGVSDEGMEVMGAKGGRSLLDMTKVCVRFPQCGQG